MKLYFYFFIFLSQLTLAQKYFQINSSIDTVNIEVNGKSYIITKKFTKIPTQYPKFDKLRITGDGDITMLANFRPDSAYTCIGACCGTIDIARTSKFNSFKDTSESEDINDLIERAKNAYLDHPYITFKLKNGTAKDSIYAWAEDAACFPHFILVDENGGKYGSAGKCFYWTNITQFSFFKTKTNYGYEIPEDEYPDISKELGKIYVRLFDDKKYIISYDLLSKKIELKYDKG